MVCLSFKLIHLVKSKLLTKAKPGLLFRFSLGFVQDGSHWDSPVNSQNLGCFLEFVGFIFFVSKPCLHKYIVFICEFTEIHRRQLFVLVLRVSYKMLITAVIIMFTLFRASASCFCAVVTGTAEQVPCNTRKKKAGKEKLFSASLPKLNEPDLIFFCTIDGQQSCIKSLREIRS